MSSNSKKRNRMAGNGKNSRSSSNEKTGRDYSYDKDYQSSPEQVSNRVKRNKARRMMEKEGKVRKGDGKDVDHKKPLKSGGSNSKSNLKVINKSKNRAKK
jgi:hypothetical protein